MAAIFYVSAQSSPAAPEGIPDYVLHGAEYAGLSMVTFRALSAGLPARVTRARALMTLAISVGYGVSDELHQRFVPLRTPDVRDVGYDLVGALLGLAVCWAWHIISTPRPGIPTVPSQR
jgi:VanZ family protein